MENENTIYRSAGGRLGGRTGQIMDGGRNKQGKKEREEILELGVKKERVE